MINQVFNQVGSGLDVLMNLVPLPGQLTIIPVKQYKPIPKPNGAPFFAMFNPEKWNKKYGQKFNEAQPSGQAKPALKFKQVDAPELSFELLLDGTGASGEKREVTALIQTLKRTTFFNGNEHRPNKLFIIWGYFIFQGVLKNLDINYTLFRPNGTPLRAKLNLTFKEDHEKLSSLMELDFRSADLTHVRILKEDERLDQITAAIYDTPRYHLQVAQANGLTTFRQPLTGQKLEFPPVENPSNA